MLVVLAFLGDNLGQHVTNDLNALKAELNRLSPRMDWQPAGLDPVYNWLVAEQTPQTVNVDIILYNWAPVLTPRKAVYGQITAVQLAAFGRRERQGSF